LPIIGFGQLTYVPDAYFENYLEANGMGNGIPNDEYVTTANIDSVTQLHITGFGISDLTGIEDFIALTSLVCYENFITSLDMSNNTFLSGLNCASNQLASLNVSNNTALITLVCGDNQLTNLDVSQNTTLTDLRCDNNQLTSLDVSQNTILTYLDCWSNYIECLDISTNIALTNLDCSDNLLEQLNTKNGNWQNMTVVANDNNLTCVEVDNIGQATNNWTFDSFTSISTNCNYTNPCQSTSVIEEHTTNKELLRTIDVLGRETKGKKNQPLFYIYNDGTVEKRL
jgi:hypothetical protein